MTPEEIAVVNDWLSDCELGWIECPTAVAARSLEKHLRGEWMPPLNIV
jgi:hypothetical protein